MMKLTIPSRPLRLPLVGLLLALATADVLAQQVCKHESIRATAPASRFTDNGNGTVTDRATGLQWKRCSEGQTWSGGTCIGTADRLDWQQALQLADMAIYAGHSDWRLPNIKELSSIVERACYDPAIDLAVFPAIPTCSYCMSWWSSSTVFTNSGTAWTMDFHSGRDEEGYKSNPHTVRMVRDGQ